MVDAEVLHEIGQFVAQNGIALFMAVLFTFVALKALRYMDRRSEAMEIRAAADDDHQKQLLSTYSSLAAAINAMRLAAEAQTRQIAVDREADRRQRETTDRILDGHTRAVAALGQEVHTTRNVVATTSGVVDTAVTTIQTLADEIKKQVGEFVTSLKRANDECIRAQREQVECGFDRMLNAQKDDLQKLQTLAQRFEAALDHIEKQHGGNDEAQSQDTDRIVFAGNPMAPVPPAGVPGGGTGR